MENQPPKFIKWLIALAIVIVLNLFFNYALHLVYPAPRFDDCLTVEPVAREMKDSKLESVTPSLEEEAERRTCYQKLESVREVYNRNAFIVLVVLGLLSLLVGYLVKTYSALSFGLSLGGVISFVVGSMRYWSAMTDYLRVIVLALALVILIWLAVKKLRE